MQIALIGDYEATLRPGADPALVLHHVVRGHDAVRLGPELAAELAGLLGVRQKRIRELGPYRAIFGDGGDLALYDEQGRRACYLNPDQAGRLLDLLRQA